MKKARLFFILVVGLFITLHIAVFVRSMELSFAIDRLEEDTKTVNKKNIDLEAYVSTLGSLDSASAAAAALGFEKSKNTLYLPLEPVAHRP